MEVSDISECSDVPGVLIERHSKQMHYTFMGSKCMIVLGHENSSKDSASKSWAQAAKELNIPETPHLFSMSSYAYLQMTRLERDQSIILLGESGSGKSISRKLLIKNICDLGRPPNAKKKTKVHSRILKVDSIISAFGHAANSNNPNATCFIPYFECQFNAHGEIVGMKTIDYLLDKSRVTGAEDGGRNFHIFNDMFDDLSPEDKTQLGLTDPAHFTYTAGSLRVLGPGDRAGALTELTEDLNSLGIGKRETSAVFKLIATILHLGNIFFVNSQKAGEAAEVKNMPKLEQVADLLGVTPTVLISVLTYRMKKVGKDFVAENLDMDGASNQRDALARSLYAGLFSWIIEKINDKICQPESEWVNFVSVLDLPGITGLQGLKNGLQRLLINYANERLLNSTYEHLVVGWNSVCASQGIYQNSLRPVISRQVMDLFESPRYGILNVIDSQTAKSGGSSDLCRAIIQNNEDSSVFLDASPNSTFMFGIKHYSGVIEYNCSKFIESNLDTLQGDFVSLIRGSPEQAGTTNVFLRSIFSDRLISTTTSARDSSVVVSAKTTDRFPSMKRKKTINSETNVEAASNTVVNQFKSNFDELLTAIYETSVWVIFHLNRGTSLHGNRVDNASIIRQTASYNFSGLKSYPALKFINDISIENLEKKYGRNPQDIDKKEILSGRKAVLLSQKAWIELEKSTESSSKEGGDMQGYAPSEHDSDTASHFGSEFDIPGSGGGINRFENSSTEERKGFSQNKVGLTSDEARPRTTLRRNWLAFVWTMTFCFPSFCLRICRMKDYQRQIAWREKVALCWIIFFMNASLLFLIIGTGWLICPQSPQLSPGQISSYTNYDNTALAYMYGSYYAIFPIITNKAHQDQNNLREFWQSSVLGRDMEQMFPKDYDDQTWSAFCPDFRRPRLFRIFGDRVIDDITQYLHFTGSSIYEKINSLPRKGTIVWDKSSLKDKMDKENYRFLIIYDRVYDVSGFYFGNYAQLPKQNFFGEDVRLIFDGALKDYSSNADINGIDVSIKFGELRRKNFETWRKTLNCMNGVMYAGRVDHRNDLSCKISDYILLAASVILVSVIGFKFLAALQCYSTSLPEESDKFAICQVPCYTEGHSSLKAAINSLATMKYDDKRKLLFLICDGMIIGAGNDLPTPRIVLEILGVDPKIDPEPLAYRSLGEGNMQLNYAKVYSGLYESNGHTVPFIVVVKVGKPSERQKPGNRQVPYLMF